MRHSSYLQRGLWVAKSAFYLSIPLTASVLAFAFAADASAGTITNINISSYFTQNWSNAINGTQIVAAPVNGNTGSGLTFSDYNGQELAVGPDSASPSQTVTLNLSGDALLLNNNTKVNALMSLFFGIDGALDAIVTFGDSNGDMMTYNLYGTDTIRDYNNNLQDNHSNALSGSDTGVTAVNWWNNCANPAVCDYGVNFQRLDAQTFTLPASWAGFTLTSMTITDPYSGSQQDDVTLSALQLSVGVPIVVSPEPASFLCLFTGLIGVGLTRRKMRSGRRAAAKP